MKAKIQIFKKKRVNTRITSLTKNKACQNDIIHYFKNELKGIMKIIYNMK